LFPETVSTKQNSDEGMGGGNGAKQMKNIEVNGADH